MEQKNKRGVAEMNLLTKIFGALMVIGVLGFIFLVVFGNLDDVADDAMPTKQAITVLNETISSVEELTGEDFTEGQGAINIALKYNAVCAIIHVSNATKNITIGAGNYTTSDSGCHIAFTAGKGDPSGFNNSDWNVSYSYTSKDPSAVITTGNLTTGMSDFFSNSTTWFTLLSVVVIITLVAFLITKIKGGNVSGGGSKSDDGLL